MTQRNHIFRLLEQVAACELENAGDTETQVMDDLRKVVERILTLPPHRRGRIAAWIETTLARAGEDEERQ